MLTFIVNIAKLTPRDIPTLVPKVKLLLLFMLIILAQSSLVYAALPWADGDKSLPSLSKMLKKVNPAVVNISTYSEHTFNQNPMLNDPFFRRFFNMPDAPQNDRGAVRRQASAGSGVIVDADKGIVMTNNHVVDGADEVRVSLTDGRHFVAQVVGSDPQLDIAILKIDADKLTDIQLGDSDALEVGDFVVAIGNPFGLGQTATTGIVSALGRSIGLSRTGYESFIQTDASINRGNSGGALVDLNGRLIGINTAIFSTTGGNVGIGFAIPISMARSSMQQIVETGEVKRGQIGVEIRDVTADMQLENKLPVGILIEKVVDDSPAKKAGLQAGDIILNVNDERVYTTHQLRSEIGKRKIGDQIKLKVSRNGDDKSFKVRVGEPGKIAGMQNGLHPLLNGASFRNTNQGIAIASIESSSPIANSRLKVNDIILGANYKNVDNLDDFAKALRLSDSQVLLKVKRRQKVFFVVIE